MNIIKSIIMAAILIVATVWLYRLGCRCFDGWEKGHNVRSLVQFALAFLGVAALYMARWEYVYPFERPVNLELHAVVDIPEEHALAYPDWYAIYEKWGIYSGSKWMDTESVSYPSRFGFDWPDMDFENHTYIVSYGREMVALTYNVWDTVDSPQITGAKAGHPVFQDVFEPNRVYIYEIEKMRIENDG